MAKLSCRCARAGCRVSQTRLSGTVMGRWRRWQWYGHVAREVGVLFALAALLVLVVAATSGGVWAQSYRVPNGLDWPSGTPVSLGNTATYATAAEACNDATVVAWVASDVASHPLQTSPAWTISGPATVSGSYCLFPLSAGAPWPDYGGAQAPVFLPNDPVSGGGGGGAPGAGQTLSCVVTTGTTSPFALTLEEGGLIGGAISLLWGAAFGLRMLRRALST